MTPVCGASSDAWDHFDLILGLGADLLPVVSDPAAVPSPKSKLKGIGKTPSLFNGSGQVVGIPGWREHVSSDQEIDRWSKDGRLGICIQTRHVRGIDIDISDPDQARAVHDFVKSHIKIDLPVRRRPNSGKCLMAVRVSGEIPKRRIATPHGVIELLANGQQFVAVGTHPSGSRYEWEGGLPYEIPEISPDALDGLWSALADRFGNGESVSGKVSARQKNGRIERDDPLANWLWEKDRVLDELNDGALVITCPFEQEHTGGVTGDGSTVYFPAGTNGYATGNFKCLHAHCEGRTQSDFEQAIGYVAVGFDVVPADVKKPRLPAFLRDKNGQIEATISNVVMALERSDVCKVHIRFDTFRDEIALSADCENWKPFKDADYTRLRMHLEQIIRFKPVGRELVRDAVAKVADDARFDTAQLWLNSLAWDGVPRIERFFEKYFGTDDTPYSRAVSLYTWSALAGRVLAPGCQADMMPILVGDQGLGKSTGVAAMSPDPEFFCVMSFSEDDDALSRKMRGCLIAEIGELRGLRTKDIESIRDFMTRKHEKWTPKYKEFVTTFPRRLIFIGTSNPKEFLADDTGNRRWLPLTVHKVDVQGIEADRALLWAEAAALFKQQGVVWKEAEQLARAEHENYTIKDSWEDDVRRWLDTADMLTGEIPRARDFLRTSDVLRDALRFDAKHVKRADEMRVSGVLKKLGYERVKIRVKGGTVWVWKANA